MKKIYLHIGSGKTGTTSIQYMLFNNQTNLLKHGYLYHTKNYTPEPNHHYLISTPFDGDMWRKDREKYQELKEIFEKSPVENMIISTENIMGAPRFYLEEIKKLFEPFDIKVIAYVRNQIELVPSHFLQRQKDLFVDYKSNLENFFNSYKMGWGNEHALILEIWLPVFGINNITARVYDKALLENGNVCLDFAKVLNISEYIGHDKIVNNISLIPEVSALVSALDSGLPKITDKSTKYFSQLRQQAIIGLLLKISESYHLNEIKFVEKYLHGIAEVVHTNFPGISTKTLYKIFVEIEKTRFILEKNVKVDLVSEQLKISILEFYKKSNFEFSSTFLNSQQSKLFLKYYDI